MNWLDDRGLNLDYATDQRDIDGSRVSLLLIVMLTTIATLCLGTALAVAQGTQATPESLTAKPVHPKKPVAKPLLVPLAPKPESNQTPAQAPTQQAQAQAVQPQGTPANDDANFQPIIQAKSAGLSACLGGINAISHMTIDSTHTAVSTWNKDTPNDRMFNSVVGLTYKNQIAPKAISVLVTAPTAAKKCDGTTVQVQPSSLACDVIEKNLSAGSKEKFNEMNSIPMIQVSQEQRYLLMPTQGNGCVVVAVNTYFAQ